ncbi:hypothetical protein [Levilactobacillus wangkuiensis]|uniref:hypothetical protein n=1 Tax=Levilactobacillus wangkuiensis TaxID=2799566 RepID=UPI00194506FF|nr:hypothetical protein [Levilactobacillus wangkuiensis]
MKALAHLSPKSGSISLIASPRRYFILYLQALPIWLILILLNCQFTLSKFNFTWNLTSWYLTLCYVTFPLVAVLLSHLRASWPRHPHPMTQAPTPWASIYAAGLPLMPLRDYTVPHEHWLPKLLSNLGKFIFAPLILLAYGLWRTFS